MSNYFNVISPVDGSVYAKRAFANENEIDNAISAGSAAQKHWAKVSIEDRKKICTRALDIFEKSKHNIAQTLTWQMGRPIRYADGEISGFLERAHFMIAAAEKALRNVPCQRKSGFNRFIKREPLGLIAVIAPWNYPYLTSVNTIIPAIMAGNTVILKHSKQTPLCAEQYEKILKKAGLPEGVFQFLHLSHKDTSRLIKAPEINFVAFTGSVSGGKAIEKTLAGSFVNVGLELGGNDPAYVRSDADLNYTIENLADGAFFNSGQSCCGIKRIYVNREIYPYFLEGFIEKIKCYKLGDPTKPDTTLGPLVSVSAADNIRTQVTKAKNSGGQTTINQNLFPADTPGSPYMTPQAMINVDHSMDIMREETFGPLVGIMRVSSDSEAIELMNDSQFGLTASVWTQNLDVAKKIGENVDTGTWFMNRCDYLDPELAWTGVKESGRGCTLSPLGYESLTRPKSFHLKTEI
ncbi:MAG: Phenylacetaldehyde dehydrogenase [Alphaproteobacteria bacterium MarineAlpha3_Bin5]|nr:MAG: Phenylacetaldehyde dehydrogenase [Alphaproteobacteria bacterium MarineAlpha3_Bin5]